MESADVVIAGGGIMGCALAYQLAKRDVDVLLLERDTLGSQSTGKCAGGVRQQFSMEANVRLQRLSVQLFEGFEEETGQAADFRQVGYLFLLTLPQHVEDFRHNMDIWHEAGLTADVTSGYAAAARRHGARLKEGVEVVGVDVAGGRVQGLRTSAGDIASRVVFNCAGAWSASIGRMAGLEIPVLPYRRHIAVTDTFPAVPRTSPMTVDFQTSLYFHPEGDGVLMGMSDRSEGPGYGTEVNWDFLEKMFEQAARRAPALAGAGIKTAWAGLYETTPDHQAILGPVPELEGFWCAAGFSGHGFMQAPAAALLVSQLLLDQRSEIDISPFAFTRFARGSLVHERNVI